MEMENKFPRRKKLREKDKVMLENEISGLLDKAEIVLDIYTPDEYPEMGIDFLQKIQELCDWRGHEVHIECRMQDLLYLYVEKWPDIN